MGRDVALPVQPPDTTTPSRRTNIRRRRRPKGPAEAEKTAPHHRVDETLGGRMRAAELAAYFVAERRLAADISLAQMGGTDCSRRSASAARSRFARSTVTFAPRKEEGCQRR